MSPALRRSIGPVALAVAGVVVGFLVMNLIVALSSLDIELGVPEGRA